MARCTVCKNNISDCKCDFRRKPETKAAVESSVCAKCGNSPDECTCYFKGKNVKGKQRKKKTGQVTGAKVYKK